VPPVRSAAPAGLRARRGLLGGQFPRHAQAAAGI